MKKSFLTLFFVLVAGFIMAQKDQMITLSNGSQIKGTIIENTEEFIRIKTSDGSVWQFQQNEVLSIQNFEDGIDPDHYVGGFYNRINLGLLGGGDNTSPSLHFVNGYAFNNHWEVGAGVGFEFISGWAYVPMFVEGRYNFLNRSSSPFVGLMTGYNAPVSRWSESKGGFTSGANVGFTHFVGDRIGITTTLGYRFARLKVVDTWWDDFETLRLVNRFEIRVGLVFK